MNDNATNFQELHWLLDVIQSADIGIVVVDKNYDIEIFNHFMQVHSGITPEFAIGASIFDLFPYLEDEWFKRRINTVFELGIPVYTTWEQRDNVFDFALKLPVHHSTQCMYQNTTFVPLRSATEEISKVAIVVYDVTETADNRINLELAKDQLLRISRTDKLTSLWNRGYWEERMLEEFKRNQRNESDACLVMFDIDHFKNINDTYGHQLGDEAIRAVSRCVLDTSREVDICGRYGGEEFAVLLPNTDVDGAFVFCERLRKAIEGMTVEYGGRSVQFTISLGIAKLTGDIKNGLDWLSNADKALYVSKESGRNMTSVFGQQAASEA